MSPMRVGGVDVLERSLVAGKMSLLDDKTTATMQFRRAFEQNAILPLFLRDAA